MKELNTEAATGGFRSKKVFLQISQNSQENILSASPATLLKKTLIQVFLVDFAKFLTAPILKNICERLPLKINI